MTLVPMTKRAATRGLLASVAAAAVLGGASALAADIAPVIPPPPPPVVVAAPVPSFELHLNALYMTRRSPDPAPLVSFYPLPGTGDVIDASDLDFNWWPGFEGRAGVILPSHIGFEGRFMWVAPLSALVETAPDDDVLLNTNPTTEFSTTNFATAFDVTRLWSTDANVTVALGGGFQLFAGAAYVRLRDTLEITLADDTFDESAVWDVLNRMVGPQVGARMKTGGGNGFFFAAEARVGLLFNSITSAFDADFTNLGNGIYTADDTANSKVLMAAGNVNVGFQVSETFAVHLGYQAMWLNNIGLATSQVGNTGELDVPGAVTLDTTTSSFLVHGVRLGFDLTF